MRQIPKKIETEFINKLGYRREGIDYRIGTIPNLHSLIPMSQSARKPIFELKSKDGVRGAHFSKVAEAHQLFEHISNRFLENAEAILDD